MKPCKSCRNYETEISRLQEEMAALSKSNDAAMERNAELKESRVKLAFENLRLAHENKQSGVLISKYLIENQDLRDLCVRLRKIADLAGKMVDWFFLGRSHLFVKRDWLGRHSFTAFGEAASDALIGYARDIRTALAAEKIDAAIHRKAEK